MNKKQKIFIGSLFLTAAFAFSSAQAAANYNYNNLHGLYVGIEGGVARALSTDVAPDWSKKSDHTWIPINGSYNTELGNAGSFGVKIGFAATENIKLDLAYNFRGNYNKQVAFPPPPSSAQDNPDGEIYKFNNINSQALTLNLNLFPSVNWNKFKPFVSGGIGVARNKFGNVQNYNIGIKDPAPFNVTLDGDTKTSFTWQLGAGLDYAVTDHVDFGLAYRFVDLGNFTTSKNVHVGKITESVQPYVINNLGVNEFYAKLTYRF